MSKNRVYQTLFLLSIFISSSYFADTYVDTFGRTYSYYKSVPYRSVARVTYHKTFSNIYLDDGSVWCAQGYLSKDEVLNWYVNDPIVIYPSEGGIHSEGYYLFNERSQTKAYVDISCSSRAGDLTYLSLIAIDYGNNIITVQDGYGQQMNFEVGSEHVYKLSSWNKNDCIILGWNKDIYTRNELYFPYILINTNAVDHVDCESIQFT
ncbi:MAG: hypothetical protein S4CHLAM20_08230 [Chlamydiia bacterium]|nr:hypothetical protein [Chlamydiia bacterium]